MAWLLGTSAQSGSLVRDGLAQHLSAWLVKTYESALVLSYCDVCHSREGLSMTSRLDAWDVGKAKDYRPVKCGYAEGFLKKYDLGEELGRGGFGIVRVVTHKQTQKQYAAKSIKKLLQVPNLPIQRQAAHLANVKREVSVLYRLRGTLNVVNFIEALEDDEDVHIIMELCTGGPLAHSLARRHYSERTVRVS